MGLLKIFSGKAPEEYEHRGDRFFGAKAFGDAKLEYEAGLHKLEKTDPGDANLKERLRAKILESKEALALQHKEQGQEILESQDYEDAEAVFRLALELTEDPELKVELRGRLSQIQEHYEQEDTIDSQDFQLEKADTPEPSFHIQEEETFTALCASFSDKHRARAYKNYGDAFREGYLALNQGDFEIAANKLSRAMEAHSSIKTYIPLELATAYLNLGRTEEARDLLTAFLEDYPESLEGYRLLCETFWEMGAFDEARELLQACPPELAESGFIRLLRGETLFQAKRFEAAKSLFLEYLNSSGWDENVALSLAKTYEALDEKEPARNLYGEVMDSCTHCGSMVAPLVKERYSRLSLECGDYSTRILELYLSLVQEDPDNRGEYYRKISEIYTAQGNDEQARRYKSFAKRSI